ncbi:MAG: CDP-glycerol glycerophosphotransferase family protein [Microbacterium sp.]|uniref:CDP-glycerol glycerophosphotransferase family protein n=1 Tax=Microbacterium sp. TaxID=51671 RepID=UPI0039E47F28
MSADDPLARGHVLEATGFSWERVHLTIRLRLSPGPDSADRPDVSFVFTDGGRVFDVPCADEGGGSFAIRVNVTTFADRAAIPDGTWRVQARLDQEPGPTASCHGGALEDLDRASRVFLYDGNRSALTVSFGVEESSEDASRLDLLVHTYHLRRSPPPRKAASVPARITAALAGTNAKRRYARAVYRLVARFVGPRPGRILFASDQQSSMEGNLLRVHERMLERGLDRQLDLRYAIRRAGTAGWLTSTRFICLMATSEVILIDDYFGLLDVVTIDRRTRVIQLWHAGSGFKSVGYSRFGIADSPHLDQPHRQYSAAISGSEHLRHVYAEAFGIEESAVVPTGLPRLDWFLDEARTAAFTEAFYAQHPHLRDKRVILFAPTFRGSSHSAAFYDYGLIDLDALYRACPPDTVVLFRMHHFVKDPLRIPEKYRDRFFDFTRFPDGLGLLHVTDLLITDYSSIIYEFALLDRPMLFFAPDKTTYAATRGFHRDYDETAPGRVCETFDEVVQAIRENEFGQDKLARFRAENFDRVDTGAADRVIDWLVLGERHTSDGE